MPNQITQALEALKDAIREAISAAESVGHPQSGGSAFRRAKEAEEAVWTAIAALSSAAPSAAEPVAPEHDVRKIMVDIVPGYDGMGREVYAKSVDEVVDLLTRMSEELEDLKRAAPPAPQSASEPVAKPPKHKFWGAGEAECPADIKAPNGELHSLRCKVCGETNPPDQFCWASVAWLSGDAEREALTDERKAYYAAFPGAVPPGDDMRWQGWQARAALHSTGKPGDEQ